LFRRVGMKTVYTRGPINLFEMYKTAPSWLVNPNLRFNMPKERADFRWIENLQASCPGPFDNSQRHLIINPVWNTSFKESPQ